MYLLYAPVEKFGNIPAGRFLLTPEAKFTNNIALVHKQYWQQILVQHGCKDVTPKFMIKLRAKRKFRQVVIFATGGMGDSIWAMPFARALDEAHPGIAIYVIVDEKAKPLWQNVPYVRGLVTYSYWNVAGLMEHADEAYTFGGVCTFLKKYKQKDPIDGIFDMGELPVPNDRHRCRPQLIVTVDEGQICTKILKENGINTVEDKFFCIGLEASTANRCWPFEYTRELSAALIADGIKVVWMGNTPEYADKYLTDEQKVAGVVNMCGKTSVREAVTIISLADLYIGPNSGLMVISTALLIPTVGIFGSFNPKIRCKYYDRFESVYGKAKCSPCDEHWTECPFGHPAPCMKLAAPSLVYDAAIRLHKKWPRSLLEKLPIQ